MKLIIINFMLKYFSIAVEIKLPFFLLKEAVRCCIESKENSATQYSGRKSIKCVTDCYHRRFKLCFFSFFLSLLPSSFSSSRVQSQFLAFVLLHPVHDKCRLSNFIHIHPHISHIIIFIEQWNVVKIGQTFEIRRIINAFVITLERKLKVKYENFSF